MSSLRYPFIRASAPASTDSRRRLLLKAGFSLATLPVIAACGNSGLATASLPEAPLPSAPPVPGPTPVPEPVPVTATAVRGIHVSYTADVAGSRSFTWFTDGLTDPGTVLEWAPVAEGSSSAEMASLPLSMRVEGNAAQAYGIDVLTHRVDLSGIPSGKAIRYRVGAGTDFSDIRVLQATPGEGFRFVHFGDSSTSAASQAVIAGTLARAPDFFLVAGDLSYANGEQSIWDDWFGLIDPLASRIPMMTTPGNHEAKDGAGAGYTSRLTQPGAQTYYSFDYQRVHFCISTAGCLLSQDDPASALALAQELAWIEIDLATAAAARAAGEIDFILFAQHYTIWTDDDTRSPNDPTLVALEEGILLRYGVDLLMVGHDHIYERSKPMGYGQPLPGGYVQITQGGGGQSLYKLLETRAAWSQLGVACHGFTEYKVEGGTIKAQSWAVSDEQGTLLPGPVLIDEFTLAARGPLAAGFALPARAPGELLARWPEVLAHTHLRNALHDLSEFGQNLGAVLGGV